MNTESSARREGRAVLDSFANCLEHSLRQLSAAPKGSTRHINAAANAAVCCIRLGQVARALKFASRALAMKPQEEYRQLVKECTYELEHQGRLRNILEGNTAIEGAVPQMLLQLKQGEQVEDVLHDLAIALEQGGVDAQIAFQVMGGYAAVMPYHARAGCCKAVVEVLLSAGICHLYCKQRAGDRAAVMQAVNGADSCSLKARIRVRWPDSVLEQLVTEVLGAAPTSSSDQPLASSTCPEVFQSALNLLLVAARDPHQRQVGLAGSDALLSRLHMSASTASSKRGVEHHEEPAGSAGDVIDEILADLVEHVAAEAGSPSCYAAATAAGGDCEQRVEMDASEADSLSMHSSMWGGEGTSTLEDAMSSGGGCECRPASTSAGAPTILQRLLDAVQQPGWLDSLPQPSMLQVVRIFSSFACSEHRFDRQLLVRAATGKALPSLLQLYEAIRHVGPGGAGAGSGPCCTACHLVLTSLLNICSHEPAVIQAEAFTLHPSRASGSGTKLSMQGSSSMGSSTPSSSTSLSSRLVLAPTALLKDLVQAAQQALQHCQPCTVPELACDGSTKGYAQGSAPADPCSSCASPLNPDAEPSLLEKWVKLLGAIAASGKAAARELHRCRVLDLLQEVLEVCRAGPASLVEAVEAAYGAMAKQCQAAAQGIFEASVVTALTGMAVYSKQPSLVLVALDRLVPLINSCSAADYQHVMQPTGIMAAVHQLMLLAGRARCGTDEERAQSGDGASSSGNGGQPMHPWDAALTAAAEARSRELGCPGLMPGSAPVRLQPVVPDFSLPQAGALKDAAQCMLLACLDRSRRQAGLKPMQVPRTGYWALVRPRELQMLERRLREEWAAAMLPKLPSQSPAAAGQAEGEQAGSSPACWRTPAAWKQPDASSPSAAKSEPSGRLLAPAGRRGTGGGVVRRAPKCPSGLEAAAAVVLTKFPEARQPEDPSPLLQGPLVAQREAPGPTGLGLPPMCPGLAAPEAASHAGKEPSASASLRSRRSESLDDTAHKEGSRSLPTSCDRAWMQACKGISADAVLSLPVESAVEGVLESSL